MTTATTNFSPTFGDRLSTLAADIKISHTLFAMPWAIFATFLAAGGWPKLGQVALIVACMVTARTVAMAANRLLDAKLDALNPRTARRAIPSGKLSVKFMTGVLVACSLTFIVATSGFLVYGNPWPLICSVPVLAYVCGYPLMKRFTRLCHFYLGAALGLAPLCAWLAIRGSIGLEPLVIAGVVLLWTAGFDIIYACQDYDSDVATGVFSVPAKFGIANALWIARLTHLMCVGLLVALSQSSPLLGPIFLVAVAIAVLLLVIEHSLVKPNDLSKLGLAFFTVNGVISLVIGTLGIIDVLM
ncbi:putative 4-hydroxybenzoate polyprenyltransferase [soil metagenome]